MEVYQLINLLFLTFGIASALFIIFLIIIRIIKNETSNLMESLKISAQDIKEELTKHEQEITNSINIEVNKLQSIFGDNNDFLNNFSDDAKLNIEKIFNDNIFIMREQIENEKNSINNFLAGVKTSLNEDLTKGNKAIENSIENKTSEIRKVFKVETNLLKKDLQNKIRKSASAITKYHQSERFTQFAGREADGNFRNPEFDPGIIRLIEELYKSGKEIDKISEKLSIKKTIIIKIIEDLNSTKNNE